MLDKHSSFNMLILYCKTVLYPTGTCGQDTASPLFTLYPPFFISHGNEKKNEKRGDAVSCPQVPVLYPASTEIQKSPVLKGNLFLSCHRRVHMNWTSFKRIPVLRWYLTLQGDNSLKSVECFDHMFVCRFQASQWSKPQREKLLCG